ncbi:MAG: HRDC domain-containing protein [Deltaproteobacteria bacterium]|nr:HRDC domain-containing protein [Deltaproteobacteria bacterium]
MAAVLPRTKDAFSGIHGVGKYKIERYGPYFLDEIRRFGGSG